MYKKTHLLCYFSTALVMFFVMLSNPPKADGTVLKEMSTSELADNSNAIVVGKVTSMRSQWSDDGTKIYTYITVSVERSIKGNLQSSEITIRQMGGEVGGVGLKVVGAPEYTEGEEILTFLEGNESNNFYCVGMAQGKYSILTDDATKKKILVRGIDKLEEKRLNLRAAGEERKLFLNDFINQIENIVGKKKK